ncbi:hypothetical protein G7046_g8101 [Stylonectria norvegica]|nr:hypothetical protein G7046_g8101 [Stylonectria norvegica]
MSVAYEPRNFIHEGAYPPIGDEHDHAADQRFTDNDVAEQLSHYTTEASMLPDDRSLLGDDRGMMPEDAATIQEATRLDLPHPSFPSPMQVQMQIPSLSNSLPDDKDLTHSSFPSPIQDPMHTPSLNDPLSDEKDLSPGAGSPSSSRIKPIPKPDRDVVKQADGKFHCPLDDCKEDTRSFSRKCEWNKHMDKHERPYRCGVDGCENLPGFTYSGGLLRHEREVHNKHGGPKNTVNCPHPNCKRHTGKGFSRQENLNEHLRRVHTNLEGATPPSEIAASPEDNDSDKAGMKRKRRSSGQGPEEITELREELKRVREENDKLRTEMNRQSQHSLAMMAQMSQLQDALSGITQHGLSGAPTAHMM